MPTDHVATVTGEFGRETKLRLVMLEHDERLLLLQEGGRYTAAIPAPLCTHDHERMDEAALCGLRACQELSAGYEGDE